MTRIFLNQFVVADDDIDLNQHVNNLAYLRWMQDVAVAHSVSQGWTLERYLAAGAGWFVRSHFIEYLKPAFAGDRVLLYTWVSDLTMRSSTRHYLVCRESDGAILAKAKTVWVFVDLRSGRPVHIPPDVRSAFPVVPNDDPELVLLTAAESRK